ncbi:MAG TPA: glycosyltransferase [bacterium]|nr:glycosyltransferase [bacterium]
MATDGNSLDRYRDVAPPGSVDALYRFGERVRGKQFVHVNSTRYGGGVAEMLHRLLPLLNQLGVETRWEVLQGDEEFFRITKSFHNAFQGDEQAISAEMLEHYLEANRRNAARLDLDGDLILIHDPQPAALIERRGRGAWVWRCHIDASHPQRRVWAFFRPLISRYDAAVFSLPRFAQRLGIPQYLIYPSIDPLSDKNRDLPAEEVQAVLARLGIPQDKPILLQVSRFDRFKDPVGVVQAYRLVKKHDDCRLVLAGGGAVDDPEGPKVLAEVQATAAGDPDVHVLVLPDNANVEINALQRAATIVLQKSTREGFGLTVAEAMWKGKPVIGGFAGGITVQIVFGTTGYTVNSPEGAAFRVRYLLNNPQVAMRMGENAREYVRRNFLITRHLADLLALLALRTRAA